MFLPLADIFGFCRDYHKPLYKAPFKVTLQRKSIEDSDKFSFHTKRNDASEKGHIHIKSLSLHLPINELNNVANAAYLSQFNGKKRNRLCF